MKRGSVQALLQERLLRSGKGIYTGQSWSLRFAVYIIVRASHSSERSTKVDKWTQGTGYWVMRGIASDLYTA